MATGKITMVTPVQNGGTGATSAAAARENLGLANISFVGNNISFMDGTKEIVFDNVTSHGFLILHGNGSFFAVYYFSVYSSGTAGAIQLISTGYSQSQATVTMNAPKITVTNSSGSAMRMTVMMLMGSISSFPS